mgnify:CR=1 FL=1
MVTEFDGGWRKRPKKYSAEYILHLYEAGVSVIDLARLCGVSRTAIYAQLVKARKQQRAEQAKVVTPA